MSEYFSQDSLCLLNIITNVINERKERNNEEIAYKHIQKQIIALI